MGLLGTALALFACAWAAPAAQAQAPCDDGCVVLTVSGPSGGSFTRTLSLAQILSVSDRGRTSYTVRGGGADDVYDAPGADQTTSVRQVLVKLLHVAPGPDTSVMIEHPDGGGRATLSGDDLNQVGTANYPFADGPPVFTSLGRDGQVTFIRPQRGAGDENRPDFLIAQRLTGTVATGAPVLSPSLTANPTTTTTNAQVTLTATDGGAGGNVSYFWEAGDGRSTTTSGPTTTFAWPSPSTYDVTVTVQGDNGTGVATGSVTVKADAAPTAGKPGGGGGAENGPKTGAPGTGNQSGGAPGAGGTGRGGTGTKGTGTRAKTGTGTSSTATGTSPRQPSTSSSTAGEARRALEQAQSRQDGKAKRVRGAVAGDRVSGVLLDASAAAAVTTPTGSSARVASATTRPATDIPRDWRWLLGGVPLALLLLGVARQTPWLTRKLPELPWRTS